MADVLLERAADAGADVGNALDLVRRRTGGTAAAGD
jgi:sirohydrochlorin cobaltochelatase